MVCSGIAQKRAPRFRDGPRRTRHGTLPLRGKTWLFAALSQGGHSDGLDDPTDARRTSSDVKCLV